MPAFSKNLSRTECAAELGLNPDRFTVALMAGGLGIGGIHDLAERLLKMDDAPQIVALAGKNKSLLDNLKILARQHPDRLFPLGFTKTVERVMAASDVAVTKPGGLTSSECLAMGLPMIVVSPIPGQEERNSDYLLEHGVAMKAHDPVGVEFKVAELAANPEKLTAMSKNARAIATPNAAQFVLKKALNGLLDR